MYKWIALWVSLPAQIITYKKFLWVMGLTEGFSPDRDAAAMGIMVIGYLLTVGILGVGSLNDSCSYGITEELRSER